MSQIAHSHKFHELQTPQRACPLQVPQVISRLVAGAHFKLKLYHWNYLSLWLLLTESPNPGGSVVASVRQLLAFTFNRSSNDQIRSSGGRRGGYF
jgi:hypothetical protein